MVEDIRDLLAIENIGNYKGVLMLVNYKPMDGVGPGDITVASLIDRVGKSGKELR